MKRHYFILPLITSISSPLVAQDAFEKLDSTVVTASRVEENLLASPYAVSLITGEDVRERNLRTVPEALRYQAGVLVQKTTHGHGSPFIRGFTGRQNLLLTDGIRVNNSTYRSGPVQYWNTLDSLAVRKMELVRGPGSVLYGSDSLGGTLNVLSKNSDFENERGWFYGGSAFYKYDSNSESHVGRLEHRFGVGKKWGAILGLSWKDYGDIRDSNIGVFQNTGYPEQNFDLKFEYALSEASKLTFAHQYLNQDEVWRWHSTRLNPGWIHDNHVTADRSVAGLNFRIYDQERSLTYLKLEGDSEKKWLQNWHATLSYQKSQDSEHRDDRFGVTDVNTYGFTFQANSELEKGTFVWGLDYYHDDVNSEASEPRRRPVADDSSYDTLGLFGQYQWDVSDKLNISAGARGSYFKADWGKVFNRTTGMDESGSENWTDLSLSLRANYSMSEEWVMYGGISQGFRAPNLEDLTGSNVSNSSDEVVGSSTVDAEKVISFELGSKYQSDSVRATGAAFYTLINDPITRVLDRTGPADLLRITNGEEGYIYGFELQGEWDITSQWTLSGNLTWQDGKQKSLSEVGGVITEDTIRRLSPFAGSLSLRWTHPDEKFWVEGTLLAAATQNNLGAGDLRDNQRVPSNGTPGYMVGSIRAGWHATNDLSFTLGLENITDEDYRVHGSGVNEQGISAVLGVKYTW